LFISSHLSIIYLAIEKVHTVTLPGKQKELGLEGFDKTIDKHFEKGYDKVQNHRHKDRHERYSRHETDESYDNMNNSRASEDSYDDRHRTRRFQRQQWDSRDDRQSRQYSPPGQSYHPRIPETQQAQYQAYPPPPKNQYYDDRYYTPATTRGRATAIAKYDNQNNNPSSSRSRSKQQQHQHRRRHRSPSRSSSSSPSNSRDYKDSPLMAFDRSNMGLGAGLAGALIGGYLGREAGDGHQKRSTALGAIIGGIGANILENRVRIYRDEIKEEQRERKAKWDAKQQQGMSNGRGGGGGERESRGQRDQQYQQQQQQQRVNRRLESPQKY
jgi:hypothetical protein